MIEDVLKAIALGAVQGLTEFLPVSSTGHLILAEEMLGVDKDRYGLAFDASLHMGTLVALLAYFGRRWVTLARAGIDAAVQRRFDDPEGRLAWLIVLGTIPAGILGVLLDKPVEDAFRNAWLVASMLILFSAMFLIAEAVGKRLRETADLRVPDALIIGCAQAVALIPGVSRSGVTICAGLVRDLKREDAATFAFLLSAPVIAGAGGVKTIGVIRDFADGTLGRNDAVFFATAIIVAAVVGYATIAFLLQYVRTNSLRPFVYYRVALGLLVVAVLIVQALW